MNNKEYTLRFKELLSDEDSDEFQIRHNACLSCEEKNPFCAKPQQFSM
jgi:hypothetical protein